MRQRWLASASRHCGGSPDEVRVESTWPRVREEKEKENILNNTLGNRLTEEELSSCNNLRGNHINLMAETSVPG